AVQRARRGNAPALMAVICLVFFAYFFVRMADYALYKSASYIQPFAICAAIASLERLGAARTVPRAGRRLLAVALAICFALSVWTSGFYLRRSLDAIGDADATFINGRFLTTQRIVDRLEAAMRASSAGVVISNAAQLSVQRIIADAAPRKNVFFVTSNLVEHAQPTKARDYIKWRPIGLIPVGPRAADLAGFVVENRPAAPRFRNAARDYLIVGPRYNVFNRAAPWRQDPFFSLVHEADVTNALAYVDSTLGVAELGDPHNSLSTLERDYFAPQETYAGIGRYLIFEIVRPSKRVRLLLDFTTMGFDAVHELPPASIIGKRRYDFPVVGGGSARVLSPPVEPFVTHGHAYVCLDMGREGALRHYPRRGLLALFGRNLPLDERRLVAYLRDLSAVSGERAPRVAALENVRRDLRASGVLYSGIYDDGWLGRRSYVTLSARRPGQHLRLKGFVPLTARGDFHTRIIVRVDGRVVTDQDVLPGEFAVEPPDALRAGVHHVALEFSALQTLPGDDGRHVGGALTSIAIAD
ncbi:MAG: hypothetical protein JWM87_4923, partial [Candidatus Eremiobacteraeota bacterium]|nr:hypothetical protein [Candidatus Eremiobacteraeota bacterium]